MNTASKRFIDTNQSHISSINYGTGENSLSDQWFDLVEHIGNRHPHIKQALTTNGYISKACKDQRKYKIFKEHISEVDISLDFADSERHNRFRGNAEAYEMALSAFDLCKDSQKQTTLVFLSTTEVVDPNNLEELFEIANKYGTLLRSNIYRPTSGFNKVSERFILEYKTLVDMIKWISINHKIIKISDRLLAAILFGQKAEDHTGISSLRILGDGSITPSTYLIGDEYRKYNISDNILFEDIGFRQYIEQDYIPEFCQSCSVRDYCMGGVVDRRLLWYGTLRERDPYCPCRYNQPTDSALIATPEFCEFSSVHDDYLPTMFFAY